MTSQTTNKFSQEVHARDTMRWCSTMRVTDHWLPKPRIIHGQRRASPSHTRGRSRAQECRSLGSARGTLSNGRPYRKHIFATAESIGHHDSEVMDDRVIDRSDA
jgi:hypothetical protein